MHRQRTVLSLAAWMLAGVAAAEPMAGVKIVRAFLDAHCLDCHGATDPEANVALHALALDAKTPAEIETWKQVYDQLDGGQMPPQDAKQPRAADRQVAMAAIKAALKAAGEKVDELKELSSARGNRVDHDALFSGQAVGAAGPPGRVWRLSAESYIRFIDRLSRTFGNEQAKGVAFDMAGIRAPWSAARQWNFADYSSSHRLSDTEIDQHVRTCTVVAKALAPRLQQAARYQGPIKTMETVMAAGKAATQDQLGTAVAETFDVLLHLPLDQDAVARYRDQLAADLQAYDPITAVERFLVAVLCHREVLYRIEMPPANEERGPLAPRHLARAIAFALTDRAPDATLWKAVADGSLSSQEDVRREVMRILDDPRIPKPRLVAFFREYFGYDGCGDVNKDDSTMNEMQMVAVQGSFFYGGELASDTDKVVELVLAADEQVLRSLLTTRKSFICTPAIEQHRATVARMAAAKQQAAERARQRGETLDEKKYEVKPIEVPPHWLWQQMQNVYGVMPREEWKTHHFKPGRQVGPVPSGPEITRDEWAKMLPFDANPAERLGILTQPSWLIAQSGNFDNHAIHRGRWIREKLLGGVIPDVPITVNAMLPQEPHHGLRERMRVTRETYCWNCHRLMDPLGLPFEQYDHFGRYRTAEIVVDKDKPFPPGTKIRPMKTVPFETAGAIESSGDPTLDGPVSGPFELIEKLAHSPRVEQVFVRHVFRYFHGRNETLADGPTLVAAHKAYRDSNGSFKALLAAVLASDSFIYRTNPPREAAAPAAAAAASVEPRSR